jgi:hypothetical protein
MNFDSKSLSRELRPAILRFQQPIAPRSRYFFFFLPGFFALAAGFANFAAFGTMAGAASGFAECAAAALRALANFLSLPFVSFGFGCSLIPDSLRRIF